jgi:arylsulfatase A-like enzyme
MLQKFRSGSLIVGVGLMVLSGVSRPAVAAERPNVLLIVSDDQRYDALGAANNAVIKTPHLDRLAREGVRFTHTFVPLPICTPSRASFLTGRFGPSNGVTFFGQSIHSDIVAWPEAMARHGYQTAVTGKWHNVRGGDAYGFEWSANVFLRGMGYYCDPPLVQRFGEDEVFVNGNSTELFTDAAVRFLKDERDEDRPFFLYVAYTAPHDPRDPPQAYADLYTPRHMVLPPNFLPEPPFDPGTLQIRDERLLPLPRPVPELRREIDHYYGLVSHMDAQIGRILEAVEEQDLEDETIVIFASDNGLTLGSHGFLGKQTLYEEGVRVPLIIRHPGLESQAGQTRDALSYLLDLMPTVCEWTDVPLPDGVQGRSLVDVCEGTKPQVREAVFGRYNEASQPLFRMVRTQRYKLIKYFKADREQLFDLKKDPYEMRDLSDDPSLASVREELRGRLFDHLVEQKDELGLKAWNR